MNATLSPKQASYQRHKARYRQEQDAVRSLKLRLLRFYKVLSACSRCGYNDDARALHFHHRDPGHKEFNLAAAYDYGWQRIEAELRKCDVLCANCHAVVK
jgi:hypothetical protein